MTEMNQYTSLILDKGQRISAATDSRVRAAVNSFIDAPFL